MARYAFHLGDAGKWRECLEWNYQIRSWASLEDGKPRWQLIQPWFDCIYDTAEKVLNKRYAINQTALNQPSLTSAALLPLLQEAAEINQLLGALGRRTIADDRASLGQSVVKKPAFKKYGSLVRRRGEGLIMSRKITAIKEFLLVLT